MKQLEHKPLPTDFFSPYPGNIPWTIREEVEPQDVLSKQKQKVQRVFRLRTTLYYDTGAWRIFNVTLRFENKQPYYSFSSQFHLPPGFIKKQGWKEITYYQYECKFGSPKSERWYMEYLPDNDPDIIGWLLERNILLNIYEGVDNLEMLLTKWVVEETPKENQTLAIHVNQFLKDYWKEMKPSKRTMPQSIDLDFVGRKQNSSLFPDFESPAPSWAPLQKNWSQLGEDLLTMAFIQDKEGKLFHLTLKYNTRTKQCTMENLSDGTSYYLLGAELTKQVTAHLIQNKYLSPQYRPVKTLSKRVTTIPFKAEHFIRPNDEVNNYNVRRWL